METVLVPLRTLIDPVGAVPLAVAGRRWLVALLLLSVLTAASGALVALRLDTSRLVLPKLEASGELMKASEREVSEKIDEAQRVALVAGVAKGVLVMPLVVLLLAVVLRLTAWLLARRALFADLFTVAAIALLPVALFHGLEALAALRLELITPAMATALVPSSLGALLGEPSSPGLARVYAAVDLVNVWAALLLGLGFAAASKWHPAKGAALGLFLYVLFAAAFLVGLPGLTPPGGGPPGGG
jgi:hypothetical protein